MFDAIISGISKIKKNYDLNDLKVRGYLSADEYSIMKDLTMYGSSEYVGNFEYFKRGTFSKLESSLNDFWEGETDAKDFFAERDYKGSILSFSRRRGAPSNDIHQAITASKVIQRQKDWGFKITTQFMSSIKKHDKKIQGRILEAITQITLSPTTSQGDTIKPLTADKKGYWRYRIGDYRLIYKPVEKLQEILLISFSSRSSVYK
jgi:mRNA interferase RelE/StbE